MARRARESAQFSVKIFSSHRCLSALVPAFAEPDIHLLPRAREGLRRRLSWCSLPVPKQSVGSLRKSCDFRRSLGQGRTWQSARFTILRFSFRCDFYAAMPAMPRTGSKSRCSRSTAMRYATSLRATASVAQLATLFVKTRPSIFDSLTFRIVSLFQRSTALTLCGRSFNPLSF